MIYSVSVSTDVYFVYKAAGIVLKTGAGTPWRWGAAKNRRTLNGKKTAVSPAAEVGQAADGVTGTAMKRRDDCIETSQTLIGCL